MALSPWRLRLLDVFARTGTVRATAAELVASPSTVSQQLGVLETEVGIPLFERAGRRLVLTAAGERLVVRARELLDLMDAVDAEMEHLATGPAGHVRLGGFASSVAPILIPAVERIGAEHPAIDVELLEIEPREALSAVLQGPLDLVVTVDEGDGAVLDASLAVTPLATDPLRVVLPVGHRLGSATTIDLAELADEAWALDHDGSYLGELVPRACRRAGFEPRVAGRFASYGILLAHVAAGHSVAVLPELAIGRTPGVVAVPVAGLDDRRIVVAARPGIARRGAVAAVRESLTGVVAA